MTQPLHLLLIEDNKEDATLIEYILKKSDYPELFLERTENASGLRSRLQLPVKWDVVISDYSLPQFTAEDALRIVREADPDIPFILVSGAVGEDLAVRMMKAGANDYIMKTSLTRLPAAIERELRETRIKREFRKAEEEVRKLSLVAKHTSNGVVFTDKNGNVEWVNNGFVEITGYSLEEIRGLKPGLFLQGEGTEIKTVKYLHDQVATRNPFYCEILNYRKSGEPFWLELLGQPLFNEDGELTNYFAIQVDITERKFNENRTRKLNEELERRVRERTSMLEAAYKDIESFGYTISHDLKAPLRNMKSYADLLSRDIEGIIPEKDKELLQIILFSADKMRRLVDGLLNFSKLGGGMVNVKDVDTADMVAQVVEKQKMQWNGHDISITQKSLPVIYADEILLQQVFENLVSNAIKYSSKNNRIEVEIGYIDQDEYYSFYIRDNGVGFRMEHAKRLFNVFSRLHSEEEFEGVGIGLALAKRIVEKHGGTIRAESIPGKGTTFYFTISKTFVAEINAA